MPLETDKPSGFKVELADGVNSGAFPDVFSRRIPLWEMAENVHFTELGAERIKGRTTLDSTGAVSGQIIRGVFQTQRSGLPTVFFGDLTKLYQYDATNGVVDRSGPSAPYALNAETVGLVDASHWSIVEFGNYILATNGVDFPQINKTGTFEDVTGMDITTAKIFVVFGPHVLAFNTDCCDREFVWCDAGDTDQWIAATDNLAGQLEIRELSTEIKAVVPLGSRLAVYGKDQMFLINYLKNDLVFGYQAALNGIGAVSPNAVVPVGRRNFGLSTQGFFVTDGASFEYIDDPAIRHWWRKNADKDQLAKVCAYHLEEDTQVRWYFHKDGDAGTENSYGISYNYEKQAWGFITEPYSACQERTVFDKPVVGDINGSLFQDSDGLNDDAASISYSLITKGLDLGDADRIKSVDSIRIGLRGSNLKYRLGWAETENGTITWEDDTALLSATDGYAFINHRTSGRWLFIEFYADVTDADWELMSIEVIGRLEGTR